MSPRPLVAVVDDDRVYTEMIGDVLDSEGFDILSIPQASAAVETISRVQPVLALLDVRMDLADSGAEVLAALRENPATAELPVIVCSADQPFLRSHAEFFREHNASVVAKPFDLDDLINAIHQALGHPTDEP